MDAAIDPASDAQKIAPRAASGRVVSVSLSPEDMDVFDARVLASGLSRSAYGRKCLMRTPPSAPPRSNVDLQRVHYLLNSVGGVMQGVAQRIAADHAMGRAGDETYDAILFELRNLNNYLRVKSVTAQSL